MHTKTLSSETTSHCARPVVVSEVPVYVPWLPFKWFGTSKDRCTFTRYFKYSINYIVVIFSFYKSLYILYLHPLAPPVVFGFPTPMGFALAKGGPGRPRRTAVRGQGQLSPREVSVDARASHRALLLPSTQDVPWRSEGTVMKLDTCYVAT